MKNVRFRTNRIVNRADEKLRKKNTDRVVLSLNSAQNCKNIHEPIGEGVKNNAQALAAQSRERVEANYVRETDQIRRCKQKRCEQLTALADRNRKEFEADRMRHIEAARRSREEFDSRQARLTQTLQLKSARKSWVSVRRWNDLVDTTAAGNGTDTRDGRNQPGDDRAEPGANSQGHGVQEEEDLGGAGGDEGAEH